MNEETEQEQQQSDGITLSVDWHFPEGFLSRYSINVLVNSCQYELIISFFVLMLLSILGTHVDLVIAYDYREVDVSEPLFHIHAVGTTKVEALKEFRRILSEELDELTADEEELGPRLRLELQYLRNLII